MKKFSLSILAILMVVLSACAASPAVANADASSAATKVADLVAQTQTSAAPTPALASATAAPTSVSTQSTNADILNTTYTNAVSVPMQLILGTLKLEGSAQALSKEQAAALVPLWDEVLTLTQSMGPGVGGPESGNSNGQDTTQQNNASAPQVSSETQTKIDELVQKIEAIMTADQLKAIAELQITQETAQTIMTEKGIMLGGPGQNGGKGGGTPPAGDQNGAGAPPAGGQTNGQASGQPSASQAGVKGGMIPSQLVFSLIQYLQQAAGLPVSTSMPTPSGGE
jgi:hypothetical protein